MVPETFADLQDDGPSTTMPTILEARRAGASTRRRGEDGDHRARSLTAHESGSGMAARSQTDKYDLPLVTEKHGTNKKKGGYARPPTALPVPDSTALEAFNEEISTEQLTVLQNIYDFPFGLANQVLLSRAACPIRFWVIDNSGSMLANDGHVMRTTSTKKVQVEACTRWTELQQSMIFHTDMAGLLQVPTVFRMLNNPGSFVGPQEFSIANTQSVHSVVGIQEEVRYAKKVMERCQAAGVTPLTEHVWQIHDQIKAMERSLRKKRSKAAVILCTDGLPSDPSGQTNEGTWAAFIQSLLCLQSLPAWIVIRLCTDEKEVVDFYNAMDRTVKMPLEVIDDFIGEAAEVHNVNPWLNYALPLHRVREMGIQHSVFDLLDERPLNRDELVQFCRLLFGDDVFYKAPCAHDDWPGYTKFLANVVNREKKQWNPNTRRMDNWIDLKRIQKHFGPSLLGRLLYKR